jgi:hypothetical protein
LTTRVSPLRTTGVSVATKPSSIAESLSVGAGVLPWTPTADGDGAPVGCPAATPSGTGPDPLGTGGLAFLICPSSTIAQALRASGVEDRSRRTPSGVHNPVARLLPKTPGVPPEVAAPRSSREDTSGTSTPVGVPRKPSGTLVLTGSSTAGAGQLGLDGKGSRLRGSAEPVGVGRTDEAFALVNVAVTTEPAITHRHPIRAATAKSLAGCVGDGGPWFSITMPSVSAIVTPSTWVSAGGPVDAGPGAGSPEADKRSPRRDHNAPTAVAIRARIPAIPPATLALATRAWLASCPFITHQIAHPAPAITVAPASATCALRVLILTSGDSSAATGRAG